MKGIILAGGMGTRLAPVTLAVSKQLLPVYDKPMIYYPLSVLMYAGIREILIITRPDELELYKKLLKDGSQWGVSFTFVPQPKPGGLPQAFVLGREFIGDGPCALALGDNVFYGDGIQLLLKQAREYRQGATIFTYPTRTPEKYGILNFDEAGKPVDIVEKPKDSKSNAAVVGLYFFDNRVCDIATELKPSGRGEVEITDVIRRYLEWEQLQVISFGRGYAWFDSGTHESLMQATAFVYTIEERQGLKIGCPEEIAFRMGYITTEQLMACATALKNSSYGEYLRGIAEGI
jgi:glucose-1-phosphate thymidylyltransferase